MPERTTRFEQTIEIEAPPEEVYSALTDPEKHSAFTGGEATGDPLVGGSFTAWDGYIEGKYLALEPPTRVLQEWLTSEWPVGQPPSLVEFRLEEAGTNRTRLTLMHSEVPAGQAESYQSGWVEYYWKPLERYFGRD